MHSPYRLRPGGGCWFIVRTDNPDQAIDFYNDESSARNAIRAMHKQWHMRRNPDPLKRFLFFHCCKAWGHRVKLAEFYERFVATLTDREREQWGKHSIRERLPKQFPCGPATGNVHCIGNLSFDPAAKFKPKRRRYRLRRGLLRLG